jgi:RNA polymerase primary sigma factor
VNHSLTQLHARKPKFHEIAAEIGVPRKDVESLLNMSLEMIPLEPGLNNDESGAVIDNYEDHTYCPENVLMKKSSREVTINVLNNLKDREKNVLIKRYEFHGGKRGTLRDISDTMGLAPETIRQIELRALEKLRNHHAEDLRPYYEVL